MSLTTYVKNSLRLKPPKHRSTPKIKMERKEPIRDNTTLSYCYSQY